MNGTSQRVIEHIRTIHGLEPTVIDAPQGIKACYKLDGEVILEFFDPEDTTVQIRVQGGEKVWYLHCGEFNSIIDHRIKGICSNSEQWHRQQMQWHGGEIVRHSESIIKRCEKAESLARLAVYIAVCTTFFAIGLIIIGFL